MFLKRKYKWGLWLGLVGIVTSATCIPLSTYHVSNSSHVVLNANHQVSDASIDYDLLDELMQSNHLQTSLQLQVKEVDLTSGSEEQDKTVLSPEQWKVAISKQKELSAFFKAHNYSLKQIHQYLIDNYPEFRNEYNKSLIAQNQNLSAVNLQTAAGIIRVRNQDAISAIPSKSEQLEQLDAAKKWLTTMAAVSGIVAVGLYVASIFGGASLIPATICTGISVTLGVAIVAVEAAIIAFSNADQQTIEAASLRVESVKLSAEIIEFTDRIDSLIDALLAVEAAASAASLVLPALLAGVGVITAIFAWLDIF